MPPSVIGSPNRQYTPPTSNDESSLHPHHHPLKPHPHQKHPFDTTLMTDTTLLTASPPSSGSDDSPTTTSAGEISFLNDDVDDTEMLDYDEDPVIPSSETFFFPSSRFTQPSSPHPFSPFSTSFSGASAGDMNGNFKAMGTDEYGVVEEDGESPGMLGSEMRGLRLNSRFPSPQASLNGSAASSSLLPETVRLEDIMLAGSISGAEETSPVTSNTLANGHTQQSFSSSMFPEKQENTQGLFQRYDPLSHESPTLF